MSVSAVHAVRLAVYAGESAFGVADHAAVVAAGAGVAIVLTFAFAAAARGASGFAAAIVLPAAAVPIFALDAFYAAARVAAAVVAIIEKEHKTPPIVYVSIGSRCLYSILFGSRRMCYSRLRCVLSILLMRMFTPKLIQKNGGAYET